MNCWPTTSSIRHVDRASHAVVVLAAAEVVAAMAVAVTAAIHADKSSLSGLIAGTKKARYP